MSLAAEMGKLPEPPNDSKPPMWNAWRHDLWVRAQQDDPRYFMRWPCIYHTMLTDHWSAQMELEFQYIVKHEVDTWELNGVGNKPIGSYHWQSSARNLAHQAYHILRWQEATGLNIADMQSIYEFGGGYGAMALVCNRLGFKGKYIIYDLPEFALLQQWYLGECGVDNVVWMPGSLSKYGFYLHEVDLFIACYSLSETDFAERDEFLARIQANSFLFLYSNKFEQYDNIAYFQAEHSFPPVKNWRHERIEHLPPESWYSWGW